MDEIKILFEIQKEKNPRFLENNSNTSLIFYNSRDKLSLSFSPEFIKLLTELLIDLEKSAENISNLTKSIMSNQTNLIHFMCFVIDLSAYKNLFQLLYSQIADLIECAKGNSFHLMSKRLFEFYSLINTYEAAESRCNFIQVLKIQIKNSFDLCDKLSKECHESKHSEFVLSRCNLDVFYNPSRVLNKLLFDINYQFFKKNQTTVLNETSKSPPSISPDIAKKIRLKERYFAMDVLDSSSYLHSTNESLILENLCVINAYYDLMSNSFKSAPNKSIHRLDFVRLTPVDQVNEIELDGAYKTLPFINYQTREEICSLKVKFLHSSQSSLQNTRNNNKKNNDETDQLNKAQNNIPVINPIYFCVFNLNQEFIFKMDNFFNSN